MIPRTSDFGSGCALRFDTKAPGPGPTGWRAMGVSSSLLQFARGPLTVMKWIGAFMAVLILIVAGLFA